HTHLRRPFKLPPRSLQAKWRVPESRAWETSWEQVLAQATVMPKRSWTWWPTRVIDHVLHRCWLRRP
ncbi:hypothetical protein DUNSADRAFT_17208, partial [Dunaliella salina]